MECQDTSIWLSFSGAPIKINEASKPHHVCQIRISKDDKMLIFLGGEIASPIPYEWLGRAVFSRKNPLFGIRHSIAKLPVGAPRFAPAADASELHTLQDTRQDPIYQQAKKRGFLETGACL